MTPADIAADQYRRRQAVLSRDLAEKKINYADAHAKLYPWLVIAAMAHAPLDELYEDGTIIYPHDRVGHTVKLHIDVALRPGVYEEALRTLANARDAAIDRFTDQPSPDSAKAARQEHDARDLAALAMHLGAPPYHCPTLKEAA